MKIHIVKDHGQKFRHGFLAGRGVGFVAMHPVMAASSICCFIALTGALAAADTTQRPATWSLDPPQVPAALAPPPGPSVVARFHAVGVQIYTCTAAPAAAGGTLQYAFTLKAPDAILYDGNGKTAGHHSAGPTWTAQDGSSVVGQKIAQADAPDADAIPWLLVRATKTTGKGVLGGVSHVQRVATAKGKAPVTGCTADKVGTEKRVDYSADYFFYGGSESATPLLAVGSVAPSFSAVAHDGHKVTLADLKGKYVVLYFYPKDDTAGCTKEACEFRDSWDKLKKSGVAVFGVSTQDNASHMAFAEKYHLPFPLLPDEKGEIAAAYRVPIVDGKARRVTYLIGKEGRIKHVWPNVVPVGHAADILTEIGST
jgi:thioredoxin-dependent peroxiredoxin